MEGGRGRIGKGGEGREGKEGRNGGGGEGRGARHGLRPPPYIEQVDIVMKERVDVAGTAIVCLSLTSSRSAPAGSDLPSHWFV